MEFQQHASAVPLLGMLGVAVMALGAAQVRVAWALSLMLIVYDTVPLVIPFTREL